MAETKTMVAPWLLHKKGKRPRVKLLRVEVHGRSGPNSRIKWLEGPLKGRLGLLQANSLKAESKADKLAQPVRKKKRKIKREKVEVVGMLRRKVVRG